MLRLDPRAVVAYARVRGLGGYQLNGRPIHVLRRRRVRPRRRRWTAAPPERSRSSRGTRDAPPFTDGRSALRAGCTATVAFSTYAEGAGGDDAAAQAVAAQPSLPRWSSPNQCPLWGAEVHDGARTLGVIGSRRDRWSRVGSGRRRRSLAPFPAGPRRPCGAPGRDDRPAAPPELVDGTLHGLHGRVRRRCRRCACRARGRAGSSSTSPR
jgi:hypothetical protein